MLPSLDNLRLFAPELVLVGGILLLFIFDLVVGRWRSGKEILTALAIVILGAVVLATFVVTPSAGQTIFAGMVRIDLFAAGFRIFFVVVAFGGILLAYLLAAMERRSPDLRVSTCSLLAPASTIGLFKTHYYPHLAASKTAFGIDQMTVYNLSARLEKDDQVAGAYRKSLLYLVSRAFEENTPSPLLGMKIHADELNTGLPKKRLEFCYSEGKKKDGARTASKTHGGFDNDVRTMNDILRRVTGNDEPKRPFTRDDLDY